MDWASTMTAENGDVVIEVWVVPRARSTTVAGLHDGALRVRVAAPPADGQANAAVARFLQDLFGVAPQLIGGSTSRRKRFLVAGCSVDEAARRLTAHFDP